MLPRLENILRHEIEFFSRSVLSTLLNGMNCYFEVVFAADS